MASGRINGDGNDGAEEKQIIKVYTRKGRGQRTKTPDVIPTDSHEKLEAKAVDGNGKGRFNPPEVLAEEALDSIVEDKNSVEVETSETISQEHARTSIEELSENVHKNDSDKVMDNSPIEVPPQAEIKGIVSTAVVDKIAMQPCSSSIDQGDTNANVVEKTVDVPSETMVQDDVNTVVIDKNSIETPPNALIREDVNMVIVDKNLIEATSHTLSGDDIHAVVVDKNPIEVSSDGDVNIIDADNTVIEAPQHTRVPSEPVPVSGPLQVMAPSTDSIMSGSMPIGEGSYGRVVRHLASSSRQHKEEIRKNLENQLNLVRDLVRRIEAKESEIDAYNDSHVLVNAGINNGGGRILTGFSSAGTPREVARASRPLNNLSISVLENTQGVNEHVEKEKRTPKANQFYRNSEFLLANEKIPPAESNKKPKSNAKKHGTEVGYGFGPGSKVFKNCCSLLERLMKHKHGWVFNTPVDVKGLGLHDYLTIIKHPMDLGTIKSRLTKNWYKSPREFVEDVRLTFLNAMTYNPKGQDVHVMAEQLSNIFEERWAVIEADYNREMRFVTDYEANLSTPRSRRAPTMPQPLINVRNVLDRADWNSRPAEMRPKPTVTTPSGRTPAPKKPKANEPNKRDMTYEEKQKLSANLQNLPPDKLDAIVQIVNKRNTAVKLRDEEIEVDIDSVDPETLWELDRFVTNYKKSLSKKKRKAELALQARVEAEKNAPHMAAAAVGEEHQREGGKAQKSIPTPLMSQAEKPGKEARGPSSSSSSSSDSSSSSSDSDSDSSSSSSG